MNVNIEKFQLCRGWGRVAKFYEDGSYDYAKDEVTGRQSTCSIELFFYFTASYECGACTAEKDEKNWVVVHQPRLGIFNVVKTKKICTGVQFIWWRVGLWREKEEQNNPNARKIKRAANLRFIFYNAGAGEEEIYTGHCI